MNNTFMRSRRIEDDSTQFPISKHISLCRIRASAMFLQQAPLTFCVDLELNL